MRRIAFFLLLIGTVSRAQTIGMTMRSGEQFETGFLGCTKDEITTTDGLIPADEVAVVSFTSYSESKSSQYSTMRSAGIRVTYDYKLGSSGKWTIRPGDVIDEFPLENGRITFSEVVQLDSVSSSEIYLRAKTYFVNHFRSAKEVIQLDDKEASIVVGRGWQNIHIEVTLLTTTSTPVQMWYKIKIQGKSSRYKYEIYDIEFTSYTSEYASSTTVDAEAVFRKTNFFTKKGTPRNIPMKYRDETLKAVQATIAGLKEAMTKPVNGKDDW